MKHSNQPPVILFGAFDRHNFGDMLFPHVASALLKKRRLIFAGLANRDLRSYGGHQVLALAQVAADWRTRRVDILHVGGELLTCDAWQAAVMLQPHDQVQPIIKHFDVNAEGRMQWARAQLGISSIMPYTVSRDLFPCARKIVYNAVGGVGLDDLSEDSRAAVLENVKTAEVLSVREKQTQAHLSVAGIPTQLLPDSAIMVKELFSSVIAACADQGELRHLLNDMAQGYIAVQFSAEFSDDDTLNRIAAQLDRVSAWSGFGIVFFRAGAAPWHDDLQAYQRVAARLQYRSVKLFSSLNIWDICSLIARSRAYCGSSLHGRIVAMAFAVPRVNLIHAAQMNTVTKQAAFAVTWEENDMPFTATVDNISQAIDQALVIDVGRLQQLANRLTTDYRKGFEALCAPLGWNNRVTIFDHAT